MMVTKESVAGIVRPLVERDDPRFAALRCAHDLRIEATALGLRGSCVRCNGTEVDASLGSLVRCAAARGYNLWIEHDLGLFIVILFNEERWGVLYLNGKAPIRKGADTPEEAVARALVAAVQGEGGRGETRE